MTTGALYEYGTNTWSSRYYADLGTPCAYYDLEGMSSLANVPPESKLFALTADQWAARMSGRQLLMKAVIDGVWQDYTPVVPLTTQATTALSSARTYVSNNYTMLNEATPTAWVTYLKALMAIANGTDTTSTTLPAAPAS